MARLFCPVAPEVMTRSRDQGRNGSVMRALFRVQGFVAACVLSSAGLEPASISQNCSSTAGLQWHKGVYTEDTQQSTDPQIKHRTIAFL